VGIRDFIHCLDEHQNRLKRSLSDREREETLREAETMVGMADAAIRELESVLGNRRVNLPEDVFLYLREEEEKVKAALSAPTSSDTMEG
jgi:hypothetical protein